MMKKQITQYIIILFIFTGCENFVAIGPPKTLVVSDVVFQSDDQAVAALTGIYSRMYTVGNNPYRIPFTTGLAGDELVNWSTDPLAVQVYQNRIDPQVGITNEFWNNGYNFIYQANAIVEGCEQSSGISQHVRQQLTAEARFIRAFWYFYLVNFFGDVPLLTTTDYRINAVAPRNTTLEIYNQIINDLNYAKEYLGTEYTDIAGKPTADRVRPNQYVAESLLARVYLYRQNWEKAILSATSVISEKSLYDTVAINDVFLKNNQEAIWQIPNPTSTNDKSTVEARWFTINTRPFSTGFNNVSTLSHNLISSFEPGDIRWTAWIGFSEDASSTPSSIFYYPAKYKETLTQTPNESSTILRLGELYLIRAEAYTHTGDLTLALDDLNIVRERAKLSPLSSEDADEILGFVERERRIELFGEWGHRWLDIKRWNKVDQVMATMDEEKGGLWTTEMQWWPIPRRDMESNPNLSQNQGYN